MPIVKFIKEKKEIEVPEGANLWSEARKAGINLNQGAPGVSDGIDRVTAAINKCANCSMLTLYRKGLGFCGTCRVQITKGMENTNEMTTREKMKFKYMPLPDPLPALAYIGNEKTMRLACMVEVNGNIEVESGPQLNLFGENFFS